MNDVERLTDQRPRDNAAQPAGHQHGERVGVGAVAAKRGQQLLAALVRHKVRSCAERVSHYFPSSQHRFRFYLGRKRGTHSGVT